MGKNIEIKARLHDLSKARELARKLGARKQAVLRQVDTYFNVKHGRLKLREIGVDQNRAELIWYQRSDRATARTSNYLIVPIDRPDAIKRALLSALGRCNVVRKRRELWIYWNVRIHLDRVANLGNFAELEAVVGKGKNDSEAASRDRVAHVMAALHIGRRDLLAKSYGDMIRSRVRRVPRLPAR